MNSKALRILSTSLVAANMIAAPFSAHAGSAPMPRPPQYVLLAFDGSLNLDMWEETLDFADENNLKLTYFISGVYFLLNSKRMEYVEPTHGAGKSAIGFGGNSPADIVRRVGYVNRAYDSGNEIASHVNGHFDGGKWSLSQWASEFKQFFHLIFDVFRINGISSPLASNPYKFQPERLVGFRAPLLGRNAAMYQELRANKFVYDTSKTGPMNYWPEKQNGVWNYPLAEVRIAGTGKKSLSMDYNFYYAQSGGKSDLANSEEFYQEMIRTYLGYFQSNYYGNRAPIHIGHHFSKWNGGAYWRAMKDFARAVCSQPEVKCVTYTELTSFMESLTPATLAAYRAGRFPKMPVTDRTLRLTSVKPLDVDLKIKLDKTEKMMVADISGKHSKVFTTRPAGVDYVWTLNGETIAMDKQPKLDVERLPRVLGSKDVLSVKVVHGRKEVLRASHRVVKPAFGEFDVAPESLEDDVLKGDQPEAHQEND